MNKDELREKQDALIKQIKGNSKDAHFADKLLSDLLSVKGQLGVEPIALDCGEIVDEKEMEICRITLTTKGILYHEYGGYSIFVRPNNRALYDTLADILAQDKEEKSEEEKEQRAFITKTIAWVLQVPKIALQDAKFTLDVATMVVKYVTEQLEKVEGQELQKETVEKDEEFRNVAVQMDKVVKEIDKEVKSVKKKKKTN